jgi:tRNA pseudouridine38-40 synthase
MGGLVEVGGGRRKPAEMGEVLASRDRTRLGPPAPPEGLWLTKVFYPEPGAADD